MRGRRAPRSRAPGFDFRRGRRRQRVRQQQRQPLRRRGRTGRPALKQLDRGTARALVRGELKHQTSGRLGSLAVPGAALLIGA